MAECNSHGLQLFVPTDQSQSMEYPDANYSHLAYRAVAALLMTQSNWWASWRLVGDVMPPGGQMGKEVCGRPRELGLVSTNTDEPPARLGSLSKRDIPDRFRRIQAATTQARLASPQIAFRQRQVTL